ncbi:MAG TPA: DUF202 domain-containing protein [Marmoricola sp.]|nr:DUF202 domain-containing protein [Marmoricola sp.]
MRHADPGRANERTALAWQRTALSLVAGAAVLARLTFDRLGVLAVGTLGVSALLALWVLAESRGRYAHDAGVRLRPRSRGGRAPAALAVAAVVVGLTEAAALLR